MGEEFSVDNYPEGSFERECYAEVTDPNNIDKLIGFLFESACYHYLDDYPKDYFPLMHEPKGLRTELHSRAKTLAEKEEPEMQRYLSSIGQVALERWKEVAVDYKSPFFEAKLNSREFSLVTDFYSLFSGKLPWQHSGEARSKKLPGFLEDLVEKQIISSLDIDPPLSTITGFDKITMNDFEFRSPERLALESDDECKESVVMTNQIVTALGSLPSIVTEGDISNIDSLHMADDCNVVYRGTNCIIISKGAFVGVKEHITAMPSKPNKDSIEIQGRHYTLRSRSSFSRKVYGFEKIYDIHSDWIAAKGYTVITKVPVEEFDKKYMADFMAHVFMYTTVMDEKDLNGEMLAFIDDYKTGHSRVVGAFAHTGVNTFEFEGNFAFSLWSRKMAKDTVQVLEDLVGFISDLGIEHALHVELGERGRCEIERKKTEREFYHANLDKGRALLEGEGYLRTLAYVVRKYRTSFLSLEQCSTCNKVYLHGYAESDDYRKDHGGVEFKLQSLHDLKEHPETFVDISEQFRYVCEILNEAKDTSPVWVECPEVMSYFSKFTELFKKYSVLHSECMCYVGMGGAPTTEMGDDIDTDCEEYEVWLEKARTVKRQLRSAEKEVDLLADEMTLCYNHLVQPEKYLNLKKHGWSTQIELLQLYQTFSVQKIDAPSYEPIIAIGTEHQIIST